MDVRVPLFDLDYGADEISAVTDVIRSRWLTMGSETSAFEKEFARRLGVKHAVAVSSGTAALHLSCLALGVGPGAEVIAPSLTFVATTNAVLYVGAQVRFADIVGPHDLNISVDEIERHITASTRAIIVMHYGGYPCQMDAILKIARDRDLVVIEDAAHAHGASFKGVALGAWGDVGCFSFFSNKNLPVGEGGMVVTSRDDVAETVRSMRSHGMTTLTQDRLRGHAHSYDVVNLGYNYRIDEMRAALGLVQMRKLDANNARRASITASYREAFAETALELPFGHSEGSPAHHIFPALLPKELDRKLFMNRLRGVGVQTSIHYPPIHTFSYYRKHYPDVHLPRTEDVAGREVTLPLYPTMTDDDVECVISAVREALPADSARPAARVSTDDFREGVR